MLYLALFTLASSCLSSKSGRVRGNEYHILRIRQAANNQVDSSDEFYCLIKATPKDIQAVMSARYQSKFDFYNLLQDSFNAHCVLDFYPKFWKDGCRTGRFSLAAGSEADSIYSKKVLDELHNTQHYNFQFLEMQNPKASSLYVGVSGFKQISYCKAFYQFQCILTKSDSVVILNGLR